MVTAAGYDPAISWVKTKRLLRFAYAVTKVVPMPRLELGISRMRAWRLGLFAYIGTKLG